MPETQDRFMRTGGCHCGAIRYETSAPPYHLTVCHCTMCRGTSGAPMVAWFSVPAAAFRWLQGEAASYRASAHATRCFCANCGTQLSFRQDGAHEIDITIASLDAAGELAPEDQTYTRSELPWAARICTLPRHATTRPETN